MTDRDRLVVIMAKSAWCSRRTAPCLCDIDPRICCAKDLEVSGDKKAARDSIEAVEREGFRLLGPDGGR